MPDVPPVHVIDEQVRAYNDRDLRRFLGHFTDDVLMRDGQGGEVARGVAALGDAYRGWFAANPDLHAEIVGRLVVGDVVVDQELVRTAQGAISAIVAYELRGGRIATMARLALEPVPNPA
jgi:hypothetical protein